MEARVPNRTLQDKPAARSAAQGFPACLVHGLQGCGDGYVERHRAVYEAPKREMLVERDGGFILRINDKGEDSRVCACRAPHGIDDEGAAELACLVKTGPFLKRGLEGEWNGARHGTSVIYG
jgi:hypothetical protein